LNADELASHFNVWHPGALAEGESGLPHGMTDAQMLPYHAYHRHLHNSPNVPGHLDHWHKQDGAMVKSFVVTLFCGCENFVYGMPELGGYITCSNLKHQSSYKIMSVREQE
jgi:hypothetical protein